MFKTPEQLLGLVMTNPNQIKREQNMVADALITLSTELIALKKKNTNIKYFSSKIPDNFFDIESLDINKTDVEEYEQFFALHESVLTNLIQYLYLQKNKLNKTATIGPEPFNMFINKVNIKTDKDVFIGASDDALAKKPDDFYLIDFETKRDLTNKSTDFVSNKLLIQKSKYLHFVISAVQLLINTIKTFPEIENNFSEVDIILKGGNLLKLLFEKISKDLNSQINDYLQTKYGKNFSSSDFDLDFKLAAKSGIDMDLYNEQRVFISNLVIIYMIAIRNILFENKEYFFEFYNLNQKAQHKLIKELVDKYNESIQNITKNDIEKSKETKQPRKYSELDGAKITGLIYDYDASSNTFISYNEPSEPVITTNLIKKDFNIINDNEMADRRAVNTEFYLIGHESYISRLGLNLNAPELASIKKSLSSTTNNFYYNTGNVNINFTGAHFSLFRTKVNFIGKIKFANGSYKLIQLPGELLDISLPKINDYKLISRKPEFYSKFLIKNIDKTITTQSHEGLINELILIIFNETFYKPWIDNKYEKRLIRLVLLITLKLLYDNDDVLFSEKIELFEKTIESINNNFSNLNLNANQTNIFNKFFSFFYVSIKETSKNSSDPNYHTFIDSVNNIFKKMANVLKFHYNLSLKKGNVHKITYLDGFK